MTTQQPQMYRLRSGSAECVIACDAQRAANILHIGRTLGEPLPGQAFRRAETGNLIDASALAPLWPDPASGWSNSPGWREGPDPAKPWKSRGCHAEDAQAVRAEYAHPDGYRSDFVIGVVADSLFKLTMTGSWPADRPCGRIALALPLPANATEALCFGGRWAGEMTIDRVPLAGGVSRINRAGSRSGHDAFPGLVAGSQGFTADSGELLAIHLGWSGNYELAVETTRDGSYRAIFYLDPRELAQRADGGFASPELYFGWSDKGLNGIRTVFQDGVRRLRQRSGAATQGKVQLNTWEGVYFEHSEDRLKAMATAAAAMGFERFVLDDGWFGRRNDDTRGLGDWTPRPEVYPNGLGGLIEHVESEGLEFGLWFEPEMVNADSALYEAHPEWILGEPDQPLGRNQYGLDLTQPACFVHLHDVLASALADPRIASVKWDMNRDLPQAAGLPLAPAATRLVESVRASRAGLEIEACASGGGRTDLSALAWCNRVWLSDAHDPDVRTPMMSAYSLFAPPEVMGCHIGPQNSHQTGRRWSLHSRASMAVLASMGMELDPLTLSASEAETVASYVELHKRHRPWLHTGHMLSLDHPDPGLSVLGVFSAERDRALLFLLQRQPRSQQVPLPLRIAHLNGKVQVSAPLLDPALHRGASVQPEWLSEAGMNCSAEFLAGHGLTLPIMAPMRGILVEILPV